MQSQVLKLNDKKALQSEISGGKGAGLARISKSGFPSLPGFIITAYGFKEFLDYNSIQFNNLRNLNDKE